MWKTHAFITGRRAAGRAARGFLTGLLCLFLWACSSNAAPPGSEEALLRIRLELAAFKQPYIHLGSQEATVFLRGMPVKTLSVRRVSSGPESPVHSSVVRRMTPLPLPEVVVVAEEIDPNPAGSVSSPDEIVGVDDMPDTFAAILEDGTCLLVWSTSGGSLPNSLARRILQSRLVYAYLGNRLRSSSPSLLELSADPAAARELFWALREQTAVIY